MSERETYSVRLLPAIMQKAQIKAIQDGYNNRSILIEKAITEYLEAHKNETES